MTVDWTDADPLIFELWVLQALRTAGFRVARTPRSGDAGADGVAVAPVGSDLPALVIQCKVVQSGRLLGPAAVREAVTSLSRYQLPVGTRAMVVTNAGGFTRLALESARKWDVVLIGRSELDELPTIAERLLRGSRRSQADTLLEGIE